MFARMTWNEYYRWYLQQLQAIYNLEEATAITILIFENKAGITRKDLVTLPGEVLSSSQKTALDNALKQLLTNKPAQQVTGEAWFYNLKFGISEDVLIPRPETEELVKWIIDENSGNISILDIGSGSGCIPVALKKNLPAAYITSIDLSKEALQVAKQNAISNKADINFLLLDFLNEDEWEQLPEFDIIVSNPPYIPANEKETMDRNVTAFEPHLALFVPNETPLLFYEAIHAFAKKHLKNDGSIYVEVHEDLAKETAALFLSTFKKVEIRKDINGKERMIKATQFL